MIDKLPPIKVCDFWDSGWCYHPEANNPKGCVGYDNCTLCKRITKSNTQEKDS